VLAVSNMLRQNSQRSILGLILSHQILHSMGEKKTPHTEKQ